MADILVVCTGNVCRSPIAEGLLRSTLADRFGDRAPSVASAGVAGWVGSSADPSSVSAAIELGVDISAHRARGIDADELASATLVLAMAQEHRDAIALLAPGVETRAFALKELVRLLESLPPSAAPEDPLGVLARRVEQADALRRAMDAPGRGVDVADPLGGPMAAFRAVAADLREWCGRLVDAVFGAIPAPAATGRS